MQLPVNLPNIITITRILLVPVTIWLIVADAYLAAFVIFILAGISDGVDGFIAKRFNLQTELGALLDPLADKLLLVGIYLSLGYFQHLPAWLVIIVASRDILIVGGVLLAWIVDNPMPVQPLWISKVNTTGQIMLAGLALGILGFMLDGLWLIKISSYVVGALTIASGAAYLRQWLAHMANGGNTDATS